MARTIIGVMGPGGGARLQDCENARKLGRLLAQRGWVTLCGGRAEGVMTSVASGVRMGGGIVIGFLPGVTAEDASPDLDLALPTGLGQARNAVNILSSDAVIACGMGLGTASEIALALKARKPVILLGATRTAQAFFRETAGRPVPAVDSPEEAVQWIADRMEEG